MQRVVATILLIAIIGQSFSQVVYYFSYLVDKASYEKYCVNKERPVLKCHGKCQMMKKIAEEEQRQQAPEMKLASKLEFFTDQHYFSFPLASTAFPIKQLYRSLSGSAPVDRAADIFHPPCNNLS